ncbi:MAG: sulfate ABC transporter ATP-binding protein [Verrucomicrobia bacterium]|nr:sulfate ABC transporter ATP-binding protein [Verrucomicrobiota bacterium]
MSIEVRDVHKTFGTFAALKGVSLKIQSGELMALLGPSGSGKTTLLRIIAGLETPDDGSGDILFHGENVAALRAAARHVGFVFQHYALFRHMTVFENIAFGLRVRPRRNRPSNDAIRGKVASLLKLVQLENFAGRYPSQLSGGQRQRVALARALAVEPRVLLLDEPFGSLDAKVRKELRAWIRRLHDEIHITSVFVTHDQDEALEVADRVAVMNEGAIEQIGTPEEVYDQPASAFVYQFLGNVNIFEGRIRNGRLRIGCLELPVSSPESADNQPARAYVRPHDIELARIVAGEGVRRGTVQHIHTAGPIVRVGVRTFDGSQTIEVEIAREKHQELDLRVGNVVYYRMRHSQIFVEDYSI